MRYPIRAMVTLLALVALAAAPLAGCGSGGGDKSGASDSKGDKKDKKDSKKGDKKGDKDAKSNKKPKNVPKKLNADDLEGKTTLVMPSPDQFLSVLAILGDPKWDELVDTIDKQDYDSKTQTAMVAGIVLAHFFVHVHAKDGDKAVAALDHMLAMADNLGVEKPEKEVKKVKKRIKKKQWAELRQDFLDMNQKLQDDLIKRQKKPDLAILISLGAYLEGANLGATIISSDYSEQRAELLRQGDLIREVKSSTKKTLKKDDKHVAMMLKSLDDLQDVMDVKADESISEDKAKEIRKLASKTRKKLLEKG